MRLPQGSMTVFVFGEADRYTSADQRMQIS